MDTQEVEKQSAAKTLWAMLLVFGLIFGGSLLLGKYCSQAKSGKDSYKITYRVEGVGEGTVTYLNQNGDLEQHTDVHFPWEKDWSGRPGQTFEFRARGRKAERLVLQILVDGKVKRSTEVTGKFASGSVSYECCD